MRPSRSACLPVARAGTGAAVQPARGGRARVVPRLSTSRAWTASEVTGAGLAQPAARSTTATKTASDARTSMAVGIRRDGQPESRTANAKAASQVSHRSAGRLGEHGRMHRRPPHAWQGGRQKHRRLRASRALIDRLAEFLGCAVVVAGELCGPIPQPHCLLKDRVDGVEDRDSSVRAVELAGE